MKDDYTVEDLLKLFESNNELLGDEYKEIQRAANFFNLLESTGTFSHAFTDLQKLTYLYMSPAVKLITGYDADDFLKKGWELSLSLYSPEVALIQKLIHREILSFLKSIPIKNKSEYKFCFSSIIKHAKGHKILVMHNVRFLKFSKEGIPQLMFSVMHQISDPNLKNKQVLIISRMKEGKEKIVQEKTFYPIFENGTLTRKELEVWKLLGEGLSSKAIAEHMNIKLNTVLTHRKKINKKLKFLKD